MPDERPTARQERERLRQRELGNADPVHHLIKAAGIEPGHPVRDSHERVALVEALMLLTHRVGELTRIVARQTPPPPSKNGDSPDA